MKYDKNKSLTENAMAGVDITEPSLPEEIVLTGEKDFEMSDELMDKLCEEINDYLSDKYGYCNSGWCYEIKVSDIMWDCEE